MKHTSTRRMSMVAGADRRPRIARQQPRLPAHVRRQIDDIYRRMDDQLTRMAEIQLQFDRLRSRIRLL
jgi:phage terminase small subunit